MAIIHFPAPMTVVNVSNEIFAKYRPIIDNKKMTLLSFRESLISSLQKSVVQSTTAEKPSNDFHYLQLINRPDQKRKQASLRCKQCAQMKIRKETVYECAICPCNPALCVQNCFKKWHDQMK